MYIKTLQPFLVWLCKIGSFGKGMDIHQRIKKIKLLFIIDINASVDIEKYGIIVKEHELFDIIPQRDKSHRISWL